jgi:hypothetical protein
MSDKTGIKSILSEVELGAGADEPFVDECPKLGSRQLGLRMSLLLCSGFNTVLRVLEKDCSTRSLLEAVRCSASARKAVLSRGLVLSAQPIDERYGNENDDPVTAYLWALSLVDAKMAAALARKVLRNGKNMYWANAMCRKILTDASAARG